VIGIYQSSWGEQQGAQCTEKGDPNRYDAHMTSGENDIALEELALRRMHWFRSVRTLMAIV